MFFDLKAEINANDLGALFGKRFSASETNTGGRSCHHGDFALVSWCRAALLEFGLLEFPVFDFKKFSSGKGFPAAFEGRFSLLNRLPGVGHNVSEQAGLLFCRTKADDAFVLPNCPTGIRCEHGFTLVVFVEILGVVRGELVQRLRGVFANDCGNPLRTNGMIRSEGAPCGEKGNVTSARETGSKRGLIQ